MVESSVCRDDPLDHDVVVHRADSSLYGLDGLLGTAWHLGRSGCPAVLVSLSKESVREPSRNSGRQAPSITAVGNQLPAA